MLDSRLISVLSSIQNQLDTLKSLSESINGISIINVSEKEEVKIVVSGSGLLLDLEIGNSASQLDNDLLSKVIVTTYQEALKTSMKEQSKYVEKYFSH